MLEELLEKLDDGECQVVFIDELPWLDTDGARIIMAIDAFWNSWAAGRDNMMLIVCGSAASWMLKNVVKEKGGLFDRLTDEMKISPFNLHETEESQVQETLKKTQTLHLTFVTTFGVKQNMYSGIVQSEVTLDDLFRS